MTFNRALTAFILLTVASFCFANKAYYSISPLTGGLPSSSIKQTSSAKVHQDDSTITVQQNKSKVFKTAIIICAITVTVIAAYGIYKMQTTDATCTEAYFDDCGESLFCNDNFCNSIGEDCTQDLVGSCTQSIVDSLTESCSSSQLTALFAKGFKIIPVYVR